MYGSGSMHFHVFYKVYGIPLVANKCAIQNHLTNGCFTFFTIGNVTAIGTEYLITCTFQCSSNIILRIKNIGKLAKKVFTKMIKILLVKDVLYLYAMPSAKLSLQG